MGFQEGPCHRKHSGQGQEEGLGTLVFKKQTGQERGSFVVALLRRGPIHFTALNIHALFLYRQ